MLAGSKDALGQRVTWARTGKTIRLFRDSASAEEVPNAGGTATLRMELASGRWFDVEEAGITEESRLEFEDGTTWRVESVVDVGRKRRRAELRIVRVSR